MFDTQSAAIAGVIGPAFGNRLKEADLAAGERLRFKSRTGADLSLMLWSKPAANPRPLVVLLPREFPAPLAADSYDADAQALVACGFAVARVNTRGTRGFGRSFADAIENNFPQVVREDIEDAVVELTAHHNIDPKRVALFGEKLGGNLAVALANSSSRFAAVVNLNGAIEMPVGYIPGAYSRAEGKPTADDRRLARQLSILESAPACRVPALHLYNEWSESGGSDASQVEALKKRTSRAGVPATYEVALPRVRDGRRITEVIADVPRIMAKAANFLLTAIP